jgi:hypothetical protein
MTDPDQKAAQKPMSPIRRVLSAVVGIPCLIFGGQLIDVKFFSGPKIDYLGALAGLLVVATGLNSIASAIWPQWWARKSS